MTGAASFAETQRLFSQADFHRSELLPWYDHHLKRIANAVMHRPNVRYFVQGQGEMRDAVDWPPPDATQSAFYLSGKKSGQVDSLNDGSLFEEPPGEDSGDTSWSYPDPMWMAGVTTFDKWGMPHHFARVITYTTVPFNRNREFTGQALPAAAGRKQTVLYEGQPRLVASVAPR